MNTIKNKVIYLAVLGALGLSACGGGGSTNSSNPSNSPKAQESTVSGVITGFGSIFVDGVEYETDNSSFTVDGRSATEDDLAIGMVVTLNGTVNPDGSTGWASHVSFDNELEGAVVENNVLTDGTLNIMGQTIRVDAETIFESKIAGVVTIDQIVAGNIVEVSGYPNGTGTIHATRLELKSSAHNSNETMEVKGVITNLDTLNKTFTLGNLTIDYSNAFLEHITSLSDGLYVEVKTNQSLNGTTLVATKVEREGNGYLERHGDDGDELEFEGIVVSLGNDSSFVVNGQTVFYNNRTEFEYGNRNDLAVNARVKVEGRFNSNGQLLAEEVKFRARSRYEVSGHIESIDNDDKSVNIMGSRISLNNHTIMKDDRDDAMEPVRYFDIDDLASDDWVEIKFYQDEQGNLVATKFERDDNDDNYLDDWSVEGYVTSIDNTNFLLEVSGYTVDYSAFPTFNVNVGARIEAEGSYNNGLLTAYEIELEDDYDDYYNDFDDHDRDDDDDDNDYDESERDHDRDDD